MGKVCTNIFFLDSEQVRMGEMLPTKEIYNFYLVGEKQVQVGEFPPNSQPHPPPHPHPTPTLKNMPASSISFVPVT